MKVIFSLFLILALSVFAEKASDRQIAIKLVQQSIASYSGNCPCPYSVMRNGRSCGKRSAWSKPGGASPLCYVEDVSKQMIQDWRNSYEAPSDSSIVN